jgi:hypothetical protein
VSGEGLVSASKMVFLLGPHRQMGRMLALCNRKPRDLLEPLLQENNVIHEGEAS